MSFRREKYVPRGGPDGGDGGNGGHVFAVATPGIDTLLDFKGRHHWAAPNGQPGMGKKCHGRDGSNLILELPRGTLLYDRETDILIKDLSTFHEEVCVAAGGKGGRGNTAFASPTNQTPQEAEPGIAGEERWLRLELKLFADVGLVGLPNAGKSTLLSRLSKARPKIADYPFTTLQPQLGIVELSGLRRFVMADIPGLIEGAHEGAGLGDEFLRHIERTRVLLHVVDVAGEAATCAPAEAYRTIRGELEKYSPTLANKPEIVAANKVDLTGGIDHAHELSSEIGGEVLPISAVTGEGLHRVTEGLWQLLQDQQEEIEEPEAPEPVSMPTPPHLREGETQ